MNVLKQDIKQHHTDFCEVTLNQGTLEVAHIVAKNQESDPCLRIAKIILWDVLIVYNSRFFSCCLA